MSKQLKMWERPSNFPSKKGLAISQSISNIIIHKFTRNIEQFRWFLAKTSMIFSSEISRELWKIDPKRYTSKSFLDGHKWGPLSGQVYCLLIYKIKNKKNKKCKLNIQAEGHQNLTETLMDLKMVSNQPQLILVNLKLLIDCVL